MAVYLTGMIYDADARGRLVGIRTQVLGVQNQVLASDFGAMELRLYGQVFELCRQKLWRSDRNFWGAPSRCARPKPGINLTQLG